MQQFNVSVSAMSAVAFLDGNVELIEDLIMQVSTASKIHDQPTPVLLGQVPGGIRFGTTRSWNCWICIHNFQGLKRIH